jgi:phosphinothricin acetyltransferase
VSTPRIRPAAESDATAVRAIYGPAVEQTVASFEEAVPDEAEIVRRMTGRPRLPWLVAESASAVVGYAYAARHADRAAYRWSANVSVYLAEEARGQGIGRSLYERLIPELTALGYLNLYAGITLPNPASQALHEALGFKLIGVYPNVGYKFGQWRDVGWWGRSVGSHPGTPAEPREWAEP